MTVARGVFFQGNFIFIYMLFVGMIILLNGLNYLIAHKNCAPVIFSC